MTAQLRALAAETVEILNCGSYSHPAGGQIELADRIAEARAGTRLYQPEDDLPLARQVPAAQAQRSGILIEVTAETTLAAARRLGEDVACLVFASAKNPGGGFRSGARAQEESLARASALYTCQTAVPEFYAFHRGQRDLLYSDRVIYSPNVPVFRADDGKLLADPYPVTFLTAAAPNLGAIIQSDQHDAAAGVPEVLRLRAARVLQVAAAHGHRRLVLGAWGCGVFRNDPATVASAFAGLLAEPPGFDHVVFAIYDRQPDSQTRQAFAEALRSPTAG